MHIAACKYYLASGDQGVLPLLTRMRDWFKNDDVHPADRDTLPELHAPDGEGALEPAGRPANISVHHGWAMSESFAYSAIVFNRPGRPAHGAGCYFDCVSRYWQSTAGFSAVQRPRTRRRIRRSRSVRGMYPARESKVIGNLLRWGTAYPAAKRLILGGVSGEADGPNVRCAQGWGGGAAFALLVQAGDLVSRWCAGLACINECSFWRSQNDRGTLRGRRLWCTVTWSSPAARRARLNPAIFWSRLKRL